ncbi:discoidin domain-containing protein [bacterium]|nr:discoidin domain-containing protein [bacterium]
MSIIPTRTYDNPLFSGSSQASHSPDVNLQYIWDQGINSEAGGWRPLNTGDLLTVNIEDAQINVNLDKDEDSVNIYTSENQSIRVESAGLDIRNLNFSTDSVEVVQFTHGNLNANANLQLGDVDVSDTNPVPSFDPKTYISLTDSTDFDSADAGSSSVSVDLHPAASPSYSKHGYIAHCYTGANNTFTGSFIFEASMDGVNWASIETRTIESSTDTTFSYYDEFNFRYSRVTFTGDANFTGTCLLQEKHDL